eukprot:TRINITY_DN2815_c0_g1_i11.p1 TRINITY_DN2815_c0_g1~~TRINITY_DN2815_c0_g1_i11.p1  ORF type:complete len:377 (+),score=-6.56 TRINITY_DN2815_c0_g1_i11:53-1183(+)
MTHSLIFTCQGENFKNESQKAELNLTLYQKSLLKQTTNRKKYKDNLLNAQNAQIQVIEENINNQFYKCLEVCKITLAFLQLVAQSSKFTFILSIKSETTLIILNKNFEKREKHQREKQMESLLKVVVQTNQQKVVNRITRKYANQIQIYTYVHILEHYKIIVLHANYSKKEKIQTLPSSKIFQSRQAQKLKQTSGIENSILQIMIPQQQVPNFLFKEAQKTKKKKRKQNPLLPERVQTREINFQQWRLIKADTNRIFKEKLQSFTKKIPLDEFCIQIVFMGQPRHTVQDSKKSLYSNNQRKNQKKRYKLNTKIQIVNCIFDSYSTPKTQLTHTHTHRHTNTQPHSHMHTTKICQRRISNSKFRITIRRRSKIFQPY